MTNRDTIHFVVGDEKALKDLLEERDVLPLLGSAVGNGFSRASLSTMEGECLWSVPESGAGDEPQGDGEIRTLYLEGEPAGQVCLEGGTAPESVRVAMANLLHDVLAATVKTNLKRMLTTEIHAQVVHQSYEELLAVNEELKKSEQRYKDLAEHLEVKVQERTEELKQAMARIFQQEKMASVGRLAAGVAHEINNPMGFVLSNMNTFGKYADRLMTLLDETRSMAALLPESSRTRLDGLWKELQIDFIREDLPDLLGQSQQGVQRVKAIVADLKGFSHVDEIEERDVELNRELERMLEVMNHDIPSGTRIDKEFGSLPVVFGHAARISQVFQNILRNAFQSRSEGLVVTITTRCREGQVMVSVADNGPGIADADLSRVFEPFFTTRTVGEGMGIGLTVAFDVVTDHGGQIEAANGPEGGALFTVTLPVERTA